MQLNHAGEHSETRQSKFNLMSTPKIQMTPQELLRQNNKAIILKEEKWYNECVETFGEDVAKLRLTLHRLGEIYNCVLDMPETAETKHVLHYITMKEEEARTTFRIKSAK